jgi:hypothetical protein
MNILQSFLTPTTVFWTTCIGTFFSLFLLSIVLNRAVVRKNTLRLVRELKISDDLKFVEVITDERQRIFAESVAKELIQRGNTSLVVVGEFTQYYYRSIICAVGSGALGAVGTFLVTSLGWDNSSDALKGYFLACAVSLPLWLSIMQVFKYSETTAKHESIYTSCSNLLCELKRVILAPESEREQNYLAKKFIEIQNKFESVRAIGVSFDGSRIVPTKVELGR